ncbi:MAG: hypothetical protein H6Q33_5067, partial [Deltaproteobacteria bacterium]|nr:hypothetical protein [Deltaproteobacteria bacterium]
MTEHRAITSGKIQDGRNSEADQVGADPLTVDAGATAAGNGRQIGREDSAVRTVLGPVRTERAAGDGSSGVRGYPPEPLGRSRIESLST